jgi:predicted nucleotidyltransferase
MNSREALEHLRRSEPDLRGVRRAAVFSSVARGENGPGSFLCEKHWSGHRRPCEP